MPLIDYAKWNRDLGEFLDDHWALKWFVLPVLFMAMLLLLLFLSLSSATMAETVRVIGLFFGFSLAIVGIGLGVEYCIYRLTGAEFVHGREEHE